MAPRKENSSSSEHTLPGGSSSNHRIKWANVYLNTSQREASRLFGSDSDRVSSCLATLLSDGYNVSFSFNEKTDSFTCTVIGKTCKECDLGWGMTSHAGDWFVALVRSLYKLFILREDMSFEEMSKEFENPLP